MKEHRSHSRTLFQSTTVSAETSRSHAVKNCAASIIAIARLIQHSLPECQSERGLRLEASACHLRALIVEDIPFHGGADLRLVKSEGLVVACMQRLLGAALERLCDRAEEAGVRLVVQCQGGELRCIETELCEAIFNLAANALEATSRGGVVFIESHVTEAGDQNISIRDHGVGIPPERLAALGTRLGSTKPGGTGLGVALAQDIVLRHGGLMHVASTVGKGTTVSVWLPRTSSDSSE